MVEQAENEDAYELIKEYLNREIKSLEAELAKKDEKEPIAEYQKLKENKILVENELISLHILSPTYREEYIAVRKENADFPKMYDDKKYLQYVWENATEAAALNCAIIRKANNVFLGYCCVKNMNKEIWELAIELFKR